ncbi:hypothetical protein [Prevotella falsenii]|uniref:hypothetical protein n=1 Tax=Prevotella falsenii TaxID=515414 RepID=UPI0012EB8671|nr:hypothetical protein [Prevotella falsenii]
MERETIGFAMRWQSDGYTIATLAKNVYGFMGFFYAFSWFRLRISWLLFAL